MYQNLIPNGHVKYYVLRTGYVERIFDKINQIKKEAKSGEIGFDLIYMVSDKGKIKTWESKKYEANELHKKINVNGAVVFKLISPFVDMKMELKLNIGSIVKLTELLSDLTYCALLDIDHVDDMEYYQDISAVVIYYDTESG